MCNWRLYGVVVSFTLEASFAGANFGKYKGMQFTADTFAEMGSVFCDALLDYCDPDQSKVCATAVDR